jgi:hypothetical protein
MHLACALVHELLLALALALARVRVRVQVQCNAGVTSHS